MKSTNHSGSRKTRALLPLLCLIFSPSLLALENDKDQPISIEADSVEIDEGTHKSTYKGNVVLTQGSIHITADNVTFHQKTKGKQVEAIGNPVTFQQDGGTKKGLIKGKAQKIEYKAADNTLILTGKAQLTQGKDSFKSDRIIYDRAKAVVKAGASAQGTERVKVTIDTSDEGDK